MRRELTKPLASVGLHTKACPLLCFANVRFWHKADEMASPLNV